MSKNRYKQYVNDYRVKWVEQRLFTDPQCLSAYLSLVDDEYFYVVEERLVNKKHFYEISIEYGVSRTSLFTHYHNILVAVYNKVNAQEK